MRTRPAAAWPRWYRRPSTRLQTGRLQTGRAAELPPDAPDRLDQLSPLPDRERFRHPLLHQLRQRSASPVHDTGHHCAILHRMRHRTVARFPLLRELRPHAVAPHTLGIQSTPHPPRPSSGRGESPTLAAPHLVADCRPCVPAAAGTRLRIYLPCDFSRRHYPACRHGTAVPVLCHSTAVAGPHHRSRPVPAIRPQSSMAALRAATPDDENGCHLPPR